MAEARRLRELEVYEDSLTTIQATMVMAFTYNMNSMDKVGWSYTEQAYAMARRIKLFDPHPAGMDDKTKSARGLTAWAIFSWQSIFTFHFFRPPLMKAPLCPLLHLKDSPEWYPELWILYPLSQNPIPVQLGEHFKTLSEFRAILNEIAGFAFGELESARNLSFDETWGFYLKLKGWYGALPDSVSVTHAVLPFQLLNQ
ncbi:hypothetical protein NW766_000685 [Fusarium irregulare]|uniref:Transcription factor domain-containing protein n=1 Tax=Fusarium irregulare TaxID=2494466 RepID=A0A9W8Q0S5_9HYPO|nr:hypothetical protein NW766_000685 [Fusarium irregulare]